jgi:hypothetical protein
VRPAGPSRSWGADSLEAGVFLIDLREVATGPGAVDAATIGEGTLEALQRCFPATATGNGHAPGRWQFVNVERLLVVDDASAFLQHATAYQYLTEAPTYGRMLCVVVGTPPAPPAVEIPAPVDRARVPVLWIGDPCGVGWRLGTSRTTRLAVSEADPDGALTIADVVAALSQPEVYDRLAEVLCGLAGRTGSPALLPWARWPSAEPGPDPGPVSQPEPVPQPEPELELEAVPVPRPEPEPEPVPRPEWPAGTWPGPGPEQGPEPRPGPAAGWGRWTWSTLAVGWSSSRSRWRVRSAGRAPGTSPRTRPWRWRAC